MGEGRPWLPASGRYRLEILSRGARTYHSQDRQIRALAKRGLIEPVQAPTTDGTDWWRITDTGRSVLMRYAEESGTAQPAAR